ncbi:Protein translocase subunit SecA [Oryzias melastigma]|uniref:Protein translocase subunit SecA n=1 Tax=Oryzias melastigma TaxID=30732 RepID=A0A834KW68_ORYME|nr:Protein translocase subunit SecA [Oryzias melastigma]
MGNKPSECHMGDELRCRICYKVLPPCTSFDHLYQDTVRGQYVHVFNGGEYYRPVGKHGMYKCKNCFNKEINDQEREEREREKREREKREREEREREEERQRREKALNQRLQESQQQAKEQYEQHLRTNISEQESKRKVLKGHLDEFESDGDRDDLLESLSLKCGFEVADLSLDELSSDQLGKILSALDKLLFEEWIPALPSLSTLQHAQVYITELCVLSVETIEEESLQMLCDHMQFLVGSISQSACSAADSFLLTQALYLTMMHFFTDSNSSDTDAVLIAKQWAEDELSAGLLFPTEFLGILISSLQNAVERESVFTLKMEIKTLKLLLSTLMDLNTKETHSESTGMVLRLVKENQWTPMEALNLLQRLSQKCEQEASITGLLTLVKVYDVSPDWRDDSGRSLTEAIDFAENINEDFPKILRKSDERNLLAALAELKLSQNLDDSMIEMIKNITKNVLMYSEHPEKHSTCMKDSIKSGSLSTDDLQSCLSLLCKAVFDSKGWWPSVKHMLQWCVMLLKEKTQVPQLVGTTADQCVLAMYAALQVCRGNKLDIVLNSDIQSDERMKEWSGFYTSLGISFNTNKTTETSSQEVYEADIVYGTFSDFVSDYIQHSKEVMGKGVPQLPRGFLIEEQSLDSLENLDLSKLTSKDLLMFGAQVLQNIMQRYKSLEMKPRKQCVKALFQVLHSNMNKDLNTESPISNILTKVSGQTLQSNEIFILTILENLVRVVCGEAEAGRWCLEDLLSCARQIQGLNEETKQIFETVLNLSRHAWSPVETLNLLGALTQHHSTEGCTSIMKVLHLLETYQVSSTWTDDSNQTLLDLLGSYQTKNLIQHLDKSLKDEKSKTIDMLFEEMRQMKDIDEQTLTDSYSIVNHVTNLIQSGEIKKYKDVERAKTLSQSMDKENLQEILAVLCSAVHQHMAEGKWWPRATQMISWCLLALSDTGKLLEMGTGEGKSCVIAMLAVLRVLRGEKVDVVSSSSVLCQRDAEEWGKFFKHFGITVDTNTNKTEDSERKECYQKDVIYGTIETFAADHLRQIFEMKDVRPDRKYQCIIIDEVDSLLLDQGVQLTYLSSPMVCMQHLNTILAMIWGHVRQYAYVSSAHQTFVRGPPASFFKAIFDSIDTEETEISDPMDILRIAEETNTVPKGFAEDIYKSKPDELRNKLKSVSQVAVVNLFEELENYVPYGFTVYTVNEKGLLSLKKLSPYDKNSIPELTFLVMEEGFCCSLYDSEETLIDPIADLISEKIQYTPCTNNKDKIRIPGFLKKLIETKMSVWTQNAFLALQLREGRDYVVENKQVCPVDFRSTGIVELNKKWGDGLQQFVEIKHQIKLSTISTVTNYISNVAFFEKYHGKIYGTTGTLGSEKDILFLKNLYPNLTACKMPAFNRKKLFEVQGIVTTSSEEWKSEIKNAVMAQISKNSYRDGRAALIICETINKAKEIHDDLKSSVPGDIILYCRSDKDSLSKIEKTLLPGDVIVATNLAGRGTDIKVSKDVNNNGGLFVILSFLSENTRVELQAFGRTARKGKPGSAQIIMSTEHLQQGFKTGTSLEEAKSTRDTLAEERISCMMNDVHEMKLREELFSDYCNTLQEVHKITGEDEKSVVVAIMNEFWGIWLQTKSEDIDQLKRDELKQSLKVDLAEAKSQSENQESPCSSIYHFVKFGNLALDDKKWDLGVKLFQKAMNQDESWAAIAFYNHAYCTIMQRKDNYLSKAREDLEKAAESLQCLNEESWICLQFVKMGSVESAKNEQTSLEKQFTTRCNMYEFWGKNISEAIEKLDEIKEKHRNAVAKKSPVFSLVSSSDEELQVEAYNLYNGGLQYAFAVEQEPSYWGASLVFFLGVLQIVAGVLLAVFTCGTLAQVGIGLITEGISDCIYGIEALVTGEFSWKDWAIQKAISIGVSLLTAGVGKLISKGFKACQNGIERFRQKAQSTSKVNLQTG